MVPPDCLEPVLKAIINNFVTERNSSEVMAVGLNAVRELCARCPLVMTEDLLRDLVEYKTYKDKAVMMASKSLIQLFRTTCPELLHKRDRGRPTEATIDLKRKEFGETDAAEFVPGAEVIEEEEDEDEDGEEGGDEDSGAEEEESDDEEGEEGEDENENREEKMLTLEEKKEKARAMTLSKILTDEDFKKIDAAQLKKQVVGVRKGGNKTKKGRKRKADEANLAEVDDEEVEAEGGRKELVNLEDIEMIYKKKRHDKETRMAAIKGGRDEEKKFGHKDKKDPNASKTNKQKSKKKNFSMMKHKIKAKGKKSFREKQMALKKRLIKNAKFTVKL